MMNLPFNHVKESIEVSPWSGQVDSPRQLNIRLKSGSPCSPSIVSTCLEELDELGAQGIDEGTIRDLSAGVYVGGADTVGSSRLPNPSIVIDRQIAPRGASSFHSRDGALSARLREGTGRD